VRSGDREMGSKHLTKKQIQNNAGKAKKAKKRADAKELQGTVAPGASSPMLPPTIRFNVLCSVLDNERTSNPTSHSSRRYVALSFTGLWVCLELDCVACERCPTTRPPSDSLVD
jgi:hypothetical protein